MTSITCSATTPPTFIGTGSLSTASILSNCKLYVPLASVDAYKTSTNEPWKSFNDVNILPIPNDVATNLVDLPSQEIKLYPTLVKDLFYVSNNDQILSVEIYSFTGSLLKTFHSSLTEYPVTDLPKGQYFVKVSTSSSVVVQKMAKI